MKWGEYIQSVIQKPILLFSTATTGVTSNDCLLAVSYAKLGAAKPTTGTIFYDAPAECALHGAEYHHITMHMLHTTGLSMRDFSDTVNQLLRESTPVSYNPAFQTIALTEMMDCEPVSIVDLPLLLKLAQSKMAIAAETLDKVVNMAGLEEIARSMVRTAPPSLKRLMRANNIVADPYNDELPVVTSVQVLQRLWELLIGIELVTY